MSLLFLTDKRTAQQTVKDVQHVNVKKERADGQRRAKTAETGCALIQRWSAMGNFYGEVSQLAI